ncbi:MAG: TonB-dependent receptor [Gemmatimonadaceae bacterium]|nr:TonB-dependent receptor [Gemmatimonadaceae bacterium]
MIGPGLAVWLQAATALTPVVSTATRDPRALVAVPGATSVVDSATLRRTRGTAVADALRLVPGVTAGSLYGSEDVRVSIRGAGNRGGFGVRGVALLLDGVPVTEPDGQGRLDLPELAIARQVDVVRGPSSALFGGAAGGGVLNIVTPRGRDLPGLGVRWWLGNPAATKADVSYGTTSGPWDLLLHAGAAAQDGYRRWSTGRVERVTVRGTRTVARDGFVAVDASASTLSQRIPGALLDAERTRDRDATEPINLTNRFTREERRWRLGLRTSLPLAGTLDAWAFASGRDNEQAIFQFIRQIQQRGQLGLRHRFDAKVGDTQWQTTVGAEVDRAQGPQTNWVNRFGAPLESTPCVVDATFGTFVPCVRQDATLSSGAVSLQSEVTRGRWALTAGARYDQVTFDIANRIRPPLSIDRRFTQLSPKVALLWRAAPTTTWWMSAARGFEVPTAVELATSPDTLKGFNDALGPSSQWQLELGWRGTIGARVAGEVAAFTADVRDDFVSRTVVIPGVPAPRAYFENAARVVKTGLEASLTAWIAPRWQLGLAQTLSDFRFRDFRTSITGSDFRPTVVDVSGNRIPGTAPWRTVVQSMWRPTNGLDLTVWGEWQGRIFVDNLNATRGTVYQRSGALLPAPAVLTGTATPYGALAPSALVHATATWRTGGVTWQLTADNLLGATWVSTIAPNAANGRFYFPGAGRAIAIGATVGTLRP